MHSSHSSFAQDLDMNPLAGWAKPASALGISTPLNHLSQSQQVQKLQQQFQHDRQFQQNTLKGHEGDNNAGDRGDRGGRSGSGSGSEFDARNEYNNQIYSRRGSVNGSFNDPHGNTNTCSKRRTLHVGVGKYVQHINIQNNDDDKNMNEEDFNGEDNTDNGSSRGVDIKMRNCRQTFQHRRSMSNLQLNQGFSGFTPISPGSGSPKSPSLSGSFTSDGNSFSHRHYHSDLHNHRNGGAVESSLSALAALSVMASMPTGPLRGGSASYPNSSSSLSLQPQDHSGNYHRSENNNSGYTSALGQQIQSQHQQGPQCRQSSSVSNMAGPSPVDLDFPQYHDQPQQDYASHQENDRQRSRSRSQPLILPPPRRSIPPRPPQISRKYHGRQVRKAPITNVVKEVVVPSRRMAHILSEQKRREKINGGFDELKSVIPECADNNDSKATILRKAVDYICLLEDEIRKNVDIYQLDQNVIANESRDHYPRQQDDD
ncbi:hypothetical protein BG011_007039 [Mortierella polycephala]|uniref:BHLH domain-containing protein n=1 Tax=Mortierella polycephala TaxID=41804 RepID=A0A9P6TYS4_9FUNG|nr:hypothetical protein BG011_007039 [Mortierella polycephala]